MGTECRTCFHVRTYPYSSEIGTCALTEGAVDLDVGGPCPAYAVQPPLPFGGEGLMPVNSRED